MESIGIPAPGETILLVTAASAATGLGRIEWVIFAAAMGAFLGDNIAFNLGRRHGRAILTRVAHLSSDQLARSEAFFERHGPKAVFIARFIPLVRMVSAYLAGINQMVPRTFILYDLAGCVSWAVLIGTLGFVFGKNLSVLEPILRRVGGVLVAVLLVGVLLLWLNRQWRENQHEASNGRLGIAFAWLQGRWQRMAQQGGRWLLVYGLLIVLSGWAVGVLIDDWVENEPELYQRDIVVAQWLRLGAEEVPAWVDEVALAGDVRLLAGVVGLTAVYLWLQKQRRFAMWTLLTFGGALLLGWGLQMVLKRPLPPFPEQMWELTPYAFPHLSSLMAVVVYGWLAYLWGQPRGWAAKVNGATLAVFGSIVIGITGLYLHQAHLSDVLVALPLGFLWLGLALALASSERVAVRV
ncbi:MAG: VTT domain-containing protein [Anaerolineales bacterium]|nr:VTT domain-containing protein [Anaerolineales bacterium]